MKWNQEERILAIEADRRYHERYFCENSLSTPGSWLEQPDDFVMRQARSLGPGAYVVDVGCGPGRLAVPIAQLLKPFQGRVLCLDYLPIALSRLQQAAHDAEVTEQIETRAADVANTCLPPETYDMCLAWSVWEATIPCHEIVAKMKELQDAAKRGGRNVLMFNTDMRRFDAASGSELDASSKLGNFKTADLVASLRSLYEGWLQIRIEMRQDEEFVRHDEREDRWTATQVLFAAAKP
ncbi:class I SAM-dependent methyltransferase [Paraburkholderia tropica]|uniref:class I SAM-dependent methyltransferase n=1 Tax=Paraburkholderia tropica TaxID=92647 RepID=UPI002AB7992B|nr:class I SAM-dependent methyltransferase [Paraburkholderia tropica]